MDMKPIHRGGIARAGYERSSRTLVVEFEGGRAKRFLGVGEEIAREFLASASPLSFLRDRLEDEYAVRDGASEEKGGAKLTASEAAKALFG